VLALPDRSTFFTISSSDQLYASFYNRRERFFFPHQLKTGGFHVSQVAVDMSCYGQASKANFTLDQKHTLDYTMNLNTEMKNGEIVYTVNGKTFPETEPIKVKKRDTVKVRLINISKTDDHPMHLHGHFFQVLSKNGKPLEGSPIIKDTLNLKQGEEYVIAFEADNEGNWKFHCHDLYHALAGMMTELNYSDYNTDFVPDPNAGNKPE